MKNENVNMIFLIFHLPTPLFWMMQQTQAIKLVMIIQAAKFKIQEMNEDPLENFRFIRQTGPFHTT